jgi:hypothetical protein
MTKEEPSSIQATIKLKKKLREFGSMGESYEAVIWKLIKNQKEMK